MMAKKGLKGSNQFLSPKLLFSSKLLILKYFIVIHPPKVKARIERSSLSDGIDCGPVRSVDHGRQAKTGTTAGRRTAPVETLPEKRLRHRNSRRRFSENPRYLHRWLPKSTTTGHHGRPGGRRAMHDKTQAFRTRGVAASERPPTPATDTPARRPEAGGASLTVGRMALSGERVGNDAWSSTAPVDARSASHGGDVGEVRQILFPRRRRGRHRCRHRAMQRLADGQAAESQSSNKKFTSDLGNREAPIARRRPQ